VVDVPLVPSKTGGRPSGIYTTVTNEDLEVTSTPMVYWSQHNSGHISGHWLLRSSNSHPLGIHWEISILKICWWQYRVFSKRRLS